MPIQTYPLIVTPISMKLFVVSTDCPPEGQRLHINGLGWGLLEQDILSTPNQLSDFICVSYSWGLGRSPSPLHPPYEVSDRTLPVLTTTIAQRPTARKIWIDAFCVPSPSQPSLRTSTLQSMGFIYSRASEVIVVLTSAALPVLQQANLTLPLSKSHLTILEAEDWVTRAWTYQEAANAYRLRITCDGSPPDTTIDSMPFFNALGQALASLPSTERTRYPHLNALEDLMADCAVAGYLQRSALQVMIVMDERTQTVPEDHFYAMMGAISTEPARAVEGVSPCEAFMQLCERKGDYSFLFSSERRDEREGMRWRPKEGELKPVLKLPSSGGGLKGEVRGGCLVLEDVVILQLGPPGEGVRGFMERWLVGFKPYGSWPDLEPEQAGFEALRVLGFSGSSEYLRTEHGLVFPQNPVPRSAKYVEILVAVEIVWTLGAPALVRYRDNTGSGVLSSA
ncbi:hypothetical protein B0T25DRAFT_630047 [Lasiosphaeria hispida]|uniref:Heterokaryon incompatibility domain-containing protein n=1 Tax=Lasiosphaeria hispida TaxID=260671 RepID=A0AAJ0MFV4_9PEZI|nr:hypothetical protein B0T25DRAFT_630047 [Lasiosphaeria hispida]